jgi:Domain of unknown function (DUF4157)
MQTFAAPTDRCATLSPQREPPGLSRHVGRCRPGLSGAEVESIRPTAAPGGFGRIGVHPPTAATPGFLQRRLTVGATNDPLEHEADRVAAERVGMPEAAVSDEAVPVRRVACGSQTETAAPPTVYEALAAPARPLDPATQAFMESRFGYDFNRVRIHTDALAERSADAVAADAYTVGSHVVFAHGRYDPGSRDGQRLLAHELAHVVQQSPPGVIARQGSKTSPPTKPKTVFHPGVMHDHQPSGRWSDVQDNPRSHWFVAKFCGHLSPMGVIQSASSLKLYDNPLATAHLKWYVRGGGKDFVEDANLELMLRTDAGAQAKILKKVPSGRTSGTFVGHVEITQNEYSDEDFRNSFGAIDRLDFEVDFDAGTIHVWFQDRYEWHPVYPFYKKMAGDEERPTNCVHAAAVELKADGAKDYWMKGEATIPLKALQSTASHKDPWRDPALPGL